MLLKNSWSLRDKLIAIISVCLITQISISYPLWLDEFRSYPSIPFFDFLAFPIFKNANYLLFFFLILSLLLFTLKKANRFIIGSYFIALLLFILNDINRLQVWIYQLNFMLAILFITSERDHKFGLKALQLILISIYFWSGIHKLNIYFIEDTFPWFIEPFGNISNSEIQYFLACSVAIIESLIGIGLIFKKTRKGACIAAFGFHVLILFVLSPFGHNWNHVVWPWNLCMIFLLYFLFYNDENKIYEYSNRKRQFFSSFSIIFALFTVMPLLNFYGAWDEQLSFKMYSGISPEGVFYYQYQEVVCIPEKMKEKFEHVTPISKKHRIILDDWVFYELKVAPYKSKKRLLQVGKKLCDCIEKPELAGLELLEVERWDKENDKFIQFTCNDLLKGRK